VGVVHETINKHLPLLFDVKRIYSPIRFALHDACEDDINKKEYGMALLRGVDEATIINAIYFTEDINYVLKYLNTNPMSTLPHLNSDELRKYALNLIMQ